MPQRNFKVFINLARIVFIGVALFPGLTYALGLSPAAIQLHNVKVGTQIESSFLLTRTHAEDEQTIQISITGSAAPYIQPKTPGDTVIFFKGQTELSYPFIVDATTLSTGSYDAFFTVKPLAESEGPSGGGSAIVVALQGRIRFTVTQEAIESYQISSIDLKQSKEGAPLILSYVFNNTGNVPARSGVIFVALMDRKTPENYYLKLIGPDELEMTPPFESKNYQIPIPAHLKSGQYAGIVSFKNIKNETVARLEPLNLSIAPGVEFQPPPRLFFAPGVLLTLSKLIFLASLLAFLLYYYRKFNS